MLNKDLRSVKRIRWSSVPATTGNNDCALNDKLRLKRQANLHKNQILSGDPEFTEKDLWKINKNSDLCY